MPIINVENGIILNLYSCLFMKISKNKGYKNIDKNKRGNIFQLEEDVDFTFNSIISNNDYLMIKGSNATGLNNLSQKMIKGY